MKKIIAIIGARPQFIKHYPIEKASVGNLNLQTVHTGQHYDVEMSDIFFNELGMKKPDFLLNTGSGNHGAQTAKMMIDIEKIILDEKPDGVLVYGDTNSTLAGALVASKLHIPVFHVEAGLRSFNKSMPEEINRILTDHVSTLFFVPSAESVKHLNNEGIRNNIFVTGDVMKDLLDLIVGSGKLSNPGNRSGYIYATIHRPYNTDDPERLLKILEALDNLQQDVILALHPRTKSIIEKNGIDLSVFKGVDFIQPQGYLNNLSYLNNAFALVTDSGGMQKEAYWMKKKCVTLRTETEWVETLTHGWNYLVFDDLSKIKSALQSEPDGYPVLYGDGNAANEIISTICNYYL